MKNSFFNEIARYKASSYGANEVLYAVLDGNIFFIKEILPSDNASSINISSKFKY